MCDALVCDTPCIRVWASPFRWFHGACTVVVDVVYVLVTALVIIMCAGQSVVMARLVSATYHMQGAQQLHSNTGPAVRVADARPSSPPRETPPRSPSLLYVRRSTARPCSFITQE